MRTDYCGNIDTRFLGQTVTLFGWAHRRRDHISVFVPTTPNITSGFFLIVPRAETIPLEMGVDAALKYIISMGVAEPPHRHPRPERLSGTDPNLRPSSRT